MWLSIKNFFSYLWFVLSLDWFQLVSAIIDVLILIWTALNWKEVAFQTSLLLVLCGVFVNFIWQIFNVAGHFSFLKEEDPKEPLTTMLKKGKDDKKDYSLIPADHELMLLKHPYVIHQDNGVLENPDIDRLLINEQIPIIPVLSNTKRKKTAKYVKQYKEIGRAHV